MQILFRRRVSHSTYSLREERGAFLVMMVFGLVVILAVAGLAIDIATMYREKLHLQKAADAGVVAGLNMRIRLGPTRDESGNPIRIAASGNKTVFELINESAQRVAQANLELKKIAVVGDIRFVNSDLLNEVDPDPTDNTVPEEVVQVDTWSDINLWILDLIPFWIFSDSPGAGSIGFQRLTARSLGELQKAHIALMLDYSGSMQCPIAQAQDPTGSCPCLQPGNACDPGQSKAQQLVIAVNTFLERFRTGYDFISIVPYNIAAKVSATMSNADPARKNVSPFNKNLWKAKVINLFDSDLNPTVTVTTAGITHTVTDPAGDSDGGPVSNTNPSDAFARAYLDSRYSVADGTQTNWWDVDEVSYVFFTDGAPTAGRLLLAAPNSLNLPTSVIDARLGSNYDYMHYKAEWNYNPTTAPMPSPLPAPYQGLANLDSQRWGQLLRWGPSTLVSSNQLSYGYVGDFPPASPCGSFTSQVPERFNVLVDCLSNSNFGFSTPPERDNSIKTYGTTVPVNHPRWIEQYYNATLALADYVRDFRGTVYAIGLGVAPASDLLLSHPCNMNGSCNRALTAEDIDPYQDAFKDFSRKDYYLARVANDRNAYIMDPGNVRTNIPRVEFHDDQILPTGLKRWSEINGVQSGFYLPTSDPTRLKEIFDSVARKILLRLTG